MQDSSLQNEIKPTLDRAQKMHQFVVDQRAGKYDQNERFELLALFLSLAESHHESILVLVGHDRLVGSALALFRSLVEAVYRGLFVAVAATPDQIKNIKQNGEPYPKFNSLAADLDELLKTETIFKSFGGDTWKTMNGYTHGGMEQLVSRINVAGKIGSYYEAAIVKELLNSATSLFVMATIPFLVMSGKDEQSKAIQQRYIDLYPLQNQHTVPADAVS